MTITFPRAMPAVGVATQVFEPWNVNFEAPEASGFIGAVAAGLPRWRAEWALPRALLDTQSDEWRAWLASLKGSMRQFYGRDFERPYPRLYKSGFAGLTRAGGGSFDGTASSWSHSVQADGQDLLTLNGLPAGFAFSAGDYVDFRWTTSSKPRRFLVRSLETASANGSGVWTGSVEPAIPSLVPGGATANLDHPECIMRLVSGQTNVTEMDRRRVAGARIVALQDILP